MPSQVSFLTNAENPMENEDDFYNANDLSQDEYEEYAHDHNTQEDEKNKEEENIHIQLSPEFREFSVASPQRWLWNSLNSGES